MSPNDERYCSGGARGILQKRSDESPLLPQQQGLQPTVVSTGSNSRRTQLAAGPVRFRVGKEPEVQEFDAQREILANANEVFYLFFNGSMPNRSEDKIPICDVDPRAFENLLRFIEGKEVHFRSATTALLTLYAANKYMEPRLAIHCLQYLNSKLSSEIVPELLVYISLFCNETKASLGHSNIVRCNSNPLFGDHSTQTSPLMSSDPMRSDANLQLKEDNVASCLEDSVTTLQNEANGRVGRRGSGGKGRHPPSTPSDKEIRKDIDLKDMWKKAKYLRHNCYEWVDCNADEILASETAEDFDQNVLHHIISRPSLGVSSETRVVDLLQRWSKSECRRKGLPVNDENKMQCLGDLRFMARYLLMDSNEFVHGYKPTKGSQGKEDKFNTAEFIPPAFSGLLTNEESLWILKRITPEVHSGGICAKPPPLSLSPWVSNMQCPRESPKRDFVTLDGKPNGSKDGRGKRKDSSMESSSVRSKLRAALSLGWRKSRGEKRRREAESEREKEKTREGGGRKRSKDSGTGQRCSGSCFAEYFFTALSCFFD